MTGEICYNAGMKTASTTTRFLSRNSHLGKNPWKARRRWGFRAGTQSTHWDCGNLGYEWRQHRLIGRTVTITNATTQHYVFDGTNMVLAFDVNDNLTDRYLWGPAVDQVLADENYSSPTSANPTSIGNNTLWALGDNQNSVRDVVTDAGVLEQHIAYSPFGQQATGTGLTTTGTVVANFAFGYTGTYTDPVTGFQLHGVRWYDPLSQRWLSEDPMGFAGGDENLYRYCRNGPTDGTDPSGLMEPLGSPGFGIPPVADHSAAPAPAFDPWALKPNWKDATGALVGTSQEVFMDFGCMSDAKLKKLEDFAWNLVVNFTGFNGAGKQEFSSGRIKPANPAQIEQDPSLNGSVIGKFTMNSAIDTAGANTLGAGDGPDSAYYVRLFTDKDTRTLTAVTLGNHMLVGVRQWHVKASRQKESWSGGYHSISAGDAILRVSTSAWEQRSGFGLNLGYWSTGQDQAKQLWSFYLNAIVRQVVSQTNTVAKTWLEVYPDRELPASSRNPFSDLLPETFRQP